MAGLRCSDPAAGYFLAPLDFYIYEAENAVPLVSVYNNYVINFLFRAVK